MRLRDEVSITLHHAEALVLFDWLVRFNDDRKADFEDQAEERVLFDLEAKLENVLTCPVSNEYKTALLKARELVRDKS
jgi:hypothetical protein